MPVQVRLIFGTFLCRHLQTDRNVKRPNFVLPGERFTTTAICKFFYFKFIAVFRI